MSDQDGDEIEDPEMSEQGEDEENDEFEDPEVSDQADNT